jgi:flagellar basal-body rod protein FlgB
MLNAIDLFQLTGDRMRYLTERQTVIARNIANADTPGYQAQDLAPPSFENALLRAGVAGHAGAAPPLVLARTDAGHLAPSPATSLAHQALSASNGSEKPDGNTVSLEEQMEKSADIADAFAVASTVYAKGISLMKIAIDNK